MPSFTDLDAEIIAKFWIYFIASFIIGFILCLFIIKKVRKTEKQLIKKYKKEIKELNLSINNLKKIISDKDNELEKLKKELCDNSLHWVLNKNSKNPTPGDTAIFNVIHSPDDQNHN